MFCARMVATEAGLFAMAGMEAKRPDERVTIKNEFCGIIFSTQGTWCDVNHNTHENQEDGVSRHQGQFDASLSRDTLEMGETLD